LSFRCFSVLVL